MSSDNLYIMFEMQKKLQKVADPRAQTYMDIEYIKDMVLASQSELNEILNEVNWKPWKQTKITFNRAAYCKEVIDLLHFVMNLAIAADMDAQEIFEVYKSKNLENFHRQERGY